MMKNVQYFILFIIIFISIALLFSKIPVPECYPSGEKTEVKTDIVYDYEKIEEVKKEVEEANAYIVRVNGKSMEPKINHDERCLCLPEDDYKLGDIVAFYIPSDGEIELISHRIIFENSTGFQTKGDSNKAEDPFFIEKEQVFCKIQETSLLEKLKQRFINIL